MLRRFRRPRVWVPLVAALAAAGVVVPVPLQITSSAEMVDAGALIQATVADPAIDEPRGHTGRYLTPATSGATLLSAAAGLLSAERHVGGTAVGQVEGLDPVEVALLAGIGIAPYRGDPARYGLSATVIGGHADPRALGVLLEVYDQVAALDVSAGRTILALALLDPDGRVVCVPGARRALADAERWQPDVIVVGAECAPDEGPVGAAVLAPPSLADAIALLTEPGT